MTNQVPSDTRIVALGAIAPLAVTALWMALALRHPTVTYHFAPGVAAASWTAALAWSGRPVGRRARAIATTGGTVLALTATLVLQSRGALAGPTLVHRGSPLVEALIVIAIATTASSLWLHRTRAS